MAVIKQMCIPSQFRDRVAEELHTNNGHIGRDRLYSSTRCRFFYPEMYVHLSNYVNTCLACQRGKRPVHPNKTPVGTLPVATPLTRWTIDFHGPFPKSQEMSYILTCIDSSSGWCELISTKDITARTVIQALHDNIITRYGVPRNLLIQSDNGSSFCASLTRLFCKTYKIKQYFTGPYNPQANARVESYADIIHKSLRMICKDQTDWAKHLQSIAYSYRASATKNAVFFSV
jgi:transposase InsO family protein